MRLLGTGSTRRAYALDDSTVLKKPRPDLDSGGRIAQIANLFELAVWLVLRDTPHAAHIAPVLGIYDNARALTQERITAPGSVGVGDLPAGFASAIYGAKIAENFGRRADGAPCIFDYGSFVALRLASRFDPLLDAKDQP